ncbi:MAG: NarK/NasA family nitrate transporter [Gammaproteobacteria bacterium PRO9]|nr:NarK/NasA family nitrate transporter [Gammaproteobacteria bacterium PRO9]
MLGMSTLAFGVSFAIWTIFSIIGIRIQRELGLSESQFGLLISIPVLSGSISRLFLGLASDRFGGRLITMLTMLASAASVWLMTFAQSFPQFLLAGAGIGLAGGTFATGIAFLSRWYPRERHGTAFGLFGVGNVGAAVTNFAAPFALLAFGWQGTARIYALVMAVMAVLYYLLTRDDPQTALRRSDGSRGTTLAVQLAPLRRVRVWRFSLYYFLFFGGFVALASWLPRYYMAVYQLDIATAGMLTAIFSFAAAVFRAFGGYLADRFGARTVLYSSFWACMGCLLILSYPPTTYIIEGISGTIQFHLRTHIGLFVTLTFVLGFFMSLGMAAVFKHIPSYFPESVGSVGGLVGMVGGLGGFFLPVIFGVINDATNIWTTAFMALFGVVSICLMWMHIVVIRIAQRYDASGAAMEYQRPGGSS